MRWGFHWLEKSSHLYCFQIASCLFIVKKTIIWSWQKPDAFWDGPWGYSGSAVPHTRPGSDTLMLQNIRLHFRTLIFACQWFGGRVGVLRWLLLPPTPSSLCRLVFAQEIRSTLDTGHGCVCPQRNRELLGVSCLELQLPLSRWLIHVPCKTAFQTCTKKQEWNMEIVFLLKTTFGAKML